MSKFVKFTGIPTEVMGGYGNANLVVGNEMNGVKFLGQTNEEQIVTYLYVTDEISFDEMFGANKYVTEMESLEAINADIDSVNVDIYKVDDPVTKQISMSEYVTEGVFSTISDMDNTWTDQQENEFLYNKGVQGISKKKKYNHITL